MDMDEEGIYLFKVHNFACGQRYAWAAVLWIRGRVFEPSGAIVLETQIPRLQLNAAHLK
jgi:hypothetical protein